jgi:hypothetical protein
MLPIPCDAMQLCWTHFHPKGTFEAVSICVWPSPGGMVGIRKARGTAEIVWYMCTEYPLYETQVSVSLPHYFPV